MLEKIDKILGRKWTQENIQKYIGTYRMCYFSYSNDIRIRENAASGGTVTAILQNELRLGNIDGALVVQSYVDKGELRTKFVIAKDEGNLHSAQGSKYISVRFASHAVPLIKEFTGRLAVVLLPCDTSMFKRMREKDPELAKKVQLVITLFCGHNSEPELTKLVVNKLRPGNSELVSYRHRIGHWRGDLKAQYENGTNITKPFSFFSDYQNLYYFCENKCLHCIDQTGYDADISVGDIWSLGMKKNPIKHNGVIVRTVSGEKAMLNAINENAVTAKGVSIETICDGQSRSLPLHYNISARSKIGPVFGRNIKDTVHERSRMIEYVLAFFILFNVWFSHSKVGSFIIPKLPRFVIKVYLYFLKGLQVL